MIPTFQRLPTSIAHVWGSIQISFGGPGSYCHTLASCFATAALGSIKVCGLLPGAHRALGLSLTSWCTPVSRSCISPCNPLSPLGWVKLAPLCSLVLHTSHRVIIEMCNYWFIAQLGAEGKQLEWSQGGLIYHYSRVQHIARLQCGIFG